MSNGPFSASQFIPTKWSTAEDKARFGNTFLHFVESDFARSLFVEKFYSRLSNCFSHIAHYVEREVMRTGIANTAWARCPDAQSLRIIPCCGRSARSMVEGFQHSGLL